MSVKLRNDRSEADTGRVVRGHTPLAGLPYLFIWPRQKHGQNSESQNPDPENTDLVVCNCPNGWRQSQDRIRIWSGSQGAALPTSFAPNLSHVLPSGPVAAALSRSPGSHVILMSATVSTLQFFFAIQLAFLAVWGMQLPLEMRSTSWHFLRLCLVACFVAISWISGVTRGPAGRHLDWLGVRANMRNSPAKTPNWFLS